MVTHWRHDDEMAIKRVLVLVPGCTFILVGIAGHGQPRNTTSTSAESGKAEATQARCEDR